MTITVHDPLEVVCGEPLTIPGSASDATGNPLDLTGATVTWTLFDYTGEIVVAKLTSNDDITISEASAGDFVVNYGAANVAPGQYRDKLTVTLPAEGSVPITQWVGTIIFVDD